MHFYLSYLSTCFAIEICIGKDAPRKLLITPKQSTCSCFSTLNHFKMLSKARMLPDWAEHAVRNHVSESVPSPPCIYISSFVIIHSVSSHGKIPKLLIPNASLDHDQCARNHQQGGGGSTVLRDSNYKHRLRTLLTCEDGQETDGCQLLSLTMAECPQDAVLPTWSN